MLAKNQEYRAECAKAAMAAWLNSPGRSIVKDGIVNRDSFPPDIAELAWAIAEAMVAEKEKRETYENAVRKLQNTPIP